MAKLVPKRNTQQTQEVETIEQQEPLEDLSREALMKRPRVSDVDFSQAAQQPARIPRVFKKYPKQKCVEPDCSHYAVGSDVFCKAHGGDPLIRENLLENENIPIGMMGKYRPEFHPMAYLTFAKQGLSDVEIAAEFGVSVYTLQDWSATFLDFNTVFEIGKALHEAWFIQEAKDNLDNRNYNTGLFKILAGNTVGWSEKTESKNLNINAGVLVVPKKMSEDEWMQHTKETKSDKKDETEAT